VGYFFNVSPDANGRPQFVGFSGSLISYNTGTGKWNATDGTNVFVAANAGLNQLYGAYLNGGNVIYVVPSPCYPPNYVFGSFPVSAFPLGAKGGFPTLDSSTGLIVQGFGSAIAGINAQQIGGTNQSSGVDIAAKTAVLPSAAPGQAGGLAIQAASGTVQSDAAAAIAAAEPLSANVTKWLGTAVTATTAGKPDVSVWGFLGTALTGTAAYIVAAFKAFFNVATPVTPTSAGYVPADMEAIKNTPLGTETSGVGSLAVSFTNTFNQGNGGELGVVGTLQDIMDSYGASYGFAATGGLVGTFVGFPLTSNGAFVFYGALGSGSAAGYFLDSNGTNWQIHQISGGSTWIGPSSSPNVGPIGTYSVSGQPDITIAAAQNDTAAASASAIWSNAQRTLTGTGGAIGPTAGANLGPIAFGPVVPGQTLDLSACVSINGQYATIEGTSAVAYTITDCETGKAVPGHSNVSLTPASVLHDTLQTDGEASNFNFRFRPSIALGLPFPEAGHYLVAVTFTVGGQPYFANFRGEARY
jgi:hypothetical protein